MRRRGSQAVELALALPLIIVLSGGAVDVGQYLYLTERVAAAASEGARAGALANVTQGENPVAIAEAAAYTTWSGQDLPGSLDVSAAVEGAVPSQRVVVSTTLTSTPLFAWLSLLPEEVTVTRTVRLGSQ
jgi:Flp pilus assembly protein TadG